MELCFSFSRRNFSQSNCVNIGFLQTISVFNKTIQIPKRNFEFPFICSTLFLLFVRRDFCFSSIVLSHCYRTNRWISFSGWDWIKHKLILWSVHCSIGIGYCIYFLFVLEKWKIQNFRNIWAFSFDCLEQSHQFSAKIHWLHFSYFHWADFSSNIFKLNITKFCTSLSVCWKTKK